MSESHAEEQSCGVSHHKLSNLHKHSPLPFRPENQHNIEKHKNSVENAASKGVSSKSSMCLLLEGTFHEAPDSRCLELQLLTRTTSSVSHNLAQNSAGWNL